MSTQQEYRRGRHVVSQLSAHLVFVTKYRRGVITDVIWSTMRDALASAAAKLDVRLVEANHDHDHIHLLINYPPLLSLSQIVNSLKGVSSRMTRQEHGKLIRGEHLWSPSYFVVSCGGAPLEVIAKYVRNQRE